MDIKKIFLIMLIAVAILGSISAVSAGLFDGLFGEEQQDNVIEIDNVTFNTTNVTAFKLSNKVEESSMYANWYVDENDTGYNLYIINCSEDDSTYNEFVKMYEDDYDNSPSQSINGVVVYTTSADSGDNAGQPRYAAYVKNKDLNSIVCFITPDANETAKMALSLKFE